MGFNQDELNSLYQYAYSLTADPDQAYDLLQSAVERFLLKKPLTLKKSSYLKKMIRNQFIDQYRHNLNYPSEPLCSVNEQLCAEQQLEQTVINRQTLEKIWQQLNPSERELLHLWAIDGLTNKQISQQLERPIGTVLSQIFRIKQKLNSSKVVSLSAIGGSQRGH
ncbi:hypothetical protein SIN8267_02440 [Sinobacterium norvegicum]|uniref:RNA polymerase sigma factor SigS n=1 Tax=Sinobacterium norvegicum TaxID=1641715 RepID=A0ABN8EPY6_9GAMM|nr:sigma-70 family RNA polymerase sigma factor [Sinobacterium norvegicum]CAH0992321.1 hypothetical protein SIN8267_02440 [Sinobacterium norvegicum]